MKTFPVWLAMSLLPALAVGVAQQRPSVSGPVGYVSSQRISNETTEGKASLARLQALQRERSADARTKQQTLEATRKQLVSAQGDADRARLQTLEQQQRAEFERAIVQSQTDIQNLQRQISTELTPKVRAAVQEVVKGTSVQVVLNGDTSVVWAAPAQDLTAAVIEQMNAQPVAPRTP